MSIKINLDVSYGQGHAQCNIEVPLEAVGVMSSSNTTAQNQQRITDFTSNTVAAILREAKETAQTVAPPLTTNGNVTAVKTEPADPTNFRNGMYVFLRDSTTGREMVFNIERAQPLQKALVAFAKRFGTTVYNLRLRAGWRLVEGRDTADTVSVLVN